MTTGFHMMMPANDRINDSICRRSDRVGRHRNGSGARGGRARDGRRDPSSGVAEAGPVSRPRNVDGPIPTGASCRFTGSVRRCRVVIPASGTRSTHKGPRTGPLIEAAGAGLPFRPPCSPDSNPIANAFARLKARLRKAAERTVAPPWAAIGRITDTFGPAECANPFSACGYDPDWPDSALGPRSPVTAGSCAEPEDQVTQKGHNRSNILKNHTISFDRKSASRWFDSASGHHPIPSGAAMPPGGPRVCRGQSASVPGAGSRASSARATWAANFAAATGSVRPRSWQR